MQLVAFEPRHHAGALQLWRRCEGVGRSDADEAAPAARFLQRNPGCSFVAFDGARLEGTIRAGHDGRRGLIHHLAVDADCRRQGLGRRLVRRALDALARRGLCALARRGLYALAREGISKCHRLVFADNGAAHAFWRAVPAAPRDALGVFSLPTRPAL